MFQMWPAEWNAWWIAGGILGGCAIIAFLGLLILLAALKIYLVITCGVCRSQASLKGQTALVTGASTGIGFETARELAKRGARVLLACRDLTKAEEAKKTLVQDTGNTDIHVFKLDLCSQKTIRECAAEIKKSERALNILIHNAGTAETRARATEDGIETTMATNHFGPFLFTLLLLDLLRSTPGARVIVVASAMHRLAPLDIRTRRLNPDPASLYVPAYQYFVSKLVNIIWAAELARRVKEAGLDITVNCLHPGMVRTEIYRHVWLPLRLPLQIIIRAFFKSTVQGVQTTIHCAVSERVKGVSGRYFSDCREYSIPRGADDPAIGKKLWELSEKVANIREDDPRI